jgi:hypothetical protein
MNSSIHFEITQDIRASIDHATEYLLDEEEESEDDDSSISS